MSKENELLTPSQVKRLEEITEFLQNVSLVLGIAHGGIKVILDGSDEEMRGKLTDLFHKLSKDVHDLYYAEVEKEIKR